MATWMDHVGVRRNNGAPNPDGDNARLAYSRGVPNRYDNRVRRNLVTQPFVTRCLVA
jgi:hypothetical protein